MTTERRKQRAKGRASWPTRDIAIAVPTANRLADYAQTVGLSSVDVATLLCTALPATPGLADEDPVRDAAQATLQALHRRWDSHTRDPLRYRPSLYDVDLPLGTDVAVLRLGPSRPDPDPMPTGGYQRDHKGADLDHGPGKVWTGARGYWDFGAPLPNFLVATRLGRILAVFSIDMWLPLPERDRVYAKSGWALQRDNSDATPMGAGDRAGRNMTATEQHVRDTFRPGNVIAFPGRGSRAYYRISPTVASARGAMARRNAADPTAPTMPAEPLRATP